MKNEWRVVHEMDDENGNPTCWAMQINNRFGKFVWITLNHKNYYDVEVDWVTKKKIEKMQEESYTMRSHSLPEVV